MCTMLASTNRFFRYQPIRRREANLEDEILSLFVSTLCEIITQTIADMFVIYFVGGMKCDVRIPAPCKMQDPSITKLINESVNVAEMFLPHLYF